MANEDRTLVIYSVLMGLAIIIHLVMLERGGLYSQTDDDLTTWKFTTIFYDVGSYFPTSGYAGGRVCEGSIHVEVVAYRITRVSSNVNEFEVSSSVQVLTALSIFLYRKLAGTTTLVIAPTFAEVIRPS